MKHSAWEHPKIDRLAEELNIPYYAAVGMLECIWHVCATHTPDGRLGLLSNIEITLKAHLLNVKSMSRSNRIINALIKTGWLKEVNQPWRLEVNDWQEHAPKWVKDKLRRQALKRGVSDARKGPLPIPIPIRNDITPPYTPPLGGQQADQGGRGVGPAVIPFEGKKPTQPDKPKSRKKSVSPHEKIIRLGESVPELDTDEFRRAWRDWVEHRRQIRHALTPATAQRQLGKLARAGPEKAIAMIEQSITNGWQGLFEPRDDQVKASSLVTDELREKTRQAMRKAGAI